MEYWFFAEGDSDEGKARSYSNDVFQPRTEKLLSGEQ